MNKVRRLDAKDAKGAEVAQRVFCGSLVSKYLFTDKA